jgi:hypothetical protein
MTLHRNPFTARRLLAAGLFLGVAAAHAASGYNVTKGQEALVAPGMTASEVQQALGHPAINIHYRNEPGPTFTYHVLGDTQTVFDVDFSASGVVLSASERMDLSGDGAGSGR